MQLDATGTACLVAFSAGSSRAPTNVCSAGREETALGGLEHVEEECQWRGYGGN